MVLKLSYAEKQVLWSFEKSSFQFFCKLLSDKVETIFWRSEAKRWRLFESKVGYRKLLRKWFWTYLGHKNEFCERLKRAFSSFLEIFEWLSGDHFLGNWTKRSKLFQSKFGHKKLLRKLLWCYLQLKNECWVLEKSIFCFFANCSLKKLKPLFGKVRQSIQSHLNQSLVIGMFLENGFEAILSSKTSVVIVWKGHFSVICKLLSDEVETSCWESEAKG